MLRSKGENFRPRTRSAKPSRESTCPGDSRDAGSRSYSADVKSKGFPDLDAECPATSSSKSADLIESGGGGLACSDCQPDLRRMAPIRAINSRGLNGFAK